MSLKLTYKELKKHYPRTIYIMKYSVIFINKIKLYCSILIFITSSINSLCSQNNSCVNAEVIVPSSVAQCQNSPVNGSDALEPETELWYKFTATSTNHTLIFTDDFYPFGFCNPTIIVHQGSCGTLATILQIQTIPNELIDTTINSLDIGSDYWIQITCSTGISIEFCLGTLPANDVCTRAVQIPTSSEVTCSYTTPVATPNFSWYKFEATVGNYKIHMKSDWNQVFIVQVIEGECELVQTAIVTDSSEFISGSSLTYWQESCTMLTDLTPSETYYIRVFNALNYIDICLYPITLDSVSEPIWTIDSLTQEIYTLDHNVGINTSNPERSLDVVGQVRIDYQPQSASSQALEVLGNVSISGELTTDSDIRYKRNICPLHSALEILIKLDPVLYNYNTDKFPERHFPDREKMGLLAQDVEKVLPNIISTDNEGFKSVNYSELIPLIIQAIKEQQREIETLKNR